MWMEEQNHDRVNVKRTLQLIDTGATTIASACPFCMTMLTDGIKSQDMQDKIQQMDVVEVLERSCLASETTVAGGGLDPMQAAVGGSEAQQAPGGAGASA
jgi:hypothetical protein